VTTPADIYNQLVSAGASVETAEAARTAQETILAAFDAANDARASKAKSRRGEVLKNTITDLVGAFLYYDRKEDEDLPVGTIEEMVASGQTSAEDIAHQFRLCLLESLK
jgi:hypothetical protein